MGADGGAQPRSLIQEALGPSVPPPMGQCGEPHRLLRRLESESTWERLINRVQTLDAFRRNGGSEMVGELAGACSAREMVDKQLSSTTNDLERLRYDADPEGRYVNPHLAVKSFQRSDASKTFTAAQTRSVVWCRRTADVCLKLQGSSDILPVPWLYRTQIGQNYKFLDIYNFLRDRFRGLWQDLTIQHAETHQGNIEVLEISCRLLILAEELLCDDPEFNAVQNASLLATCLDKLMASYDKVRGFDADARANVRPTESLRSQFDASLLRELIDVLVYASPHEAEFWSYRIVLCLASADAMSTYNVISKLPPEIRDNHLVVFTVHCIRAYFNNNTTRYLRCVRAAPPLLAVLLAKYRDIARHRLVAAVASKQQRARSAKIPAEIFCRMFDLYNLDELDAFCESIRALTIPARSNHDGFKGLEIDVSAAVADSPERLVKAARLPDTRLRHCLNTFPGGRLRLLDPNEPYSVTTFVAPSASPQSGMFSARSQRLLPIAARGSPAASIRKLTEPLSADEGSAEPTLELPVTNEKQSDSDGIAVEKSRKRGAHMMSPQVSKKQKSESKSELVHAIQQEIRCHPNLYEQFVSALNSQPVPSLAAFDTHAASTKLRAKLGVRHTLPEPKATCFCIKVCGSARSPLPVVLDALMLGTYETDGLLPAWSMVTQPVPLASGGRSVLWLKEKGSTLGSVAVSYVSEREEQPSSPPASSPSCQSEPPAPSAESGGKGCDISAGAALAETDDNDSLREEIPCLIYCCGSELKISRNSLDLKLPWRVDNPRTVLHALEKVRSLRVRARGLLLVWQVCVVTPNCEIAADDLDLITEAIRQSAHNALAVNTPLQQALAPLLTRGSLPKASCATLMLRTIHGPAEVRLSMLEQSLAHLASVAQPLVIWPSVRTCSLPFMLLNIWKKEINEMGQPSSEVSVLVSCLESGLTKFLKLPYWHRAPLNAHIQEELHNMNANELKAVRRVLKKVRKACVVAIAQKLVISREKEHARKSLNISTPSSRFAERIVEAHQLVRSVIKSAISSVEEALGLSLLRAKFMLPVPLQIYCQTQHLKLSCTSAG